MKSKMQNCRHCGAEIAPGAKTCPQCGGKNGKPFYKKPWFIVLALLIAIGVIGGSSDKGNGSSAGTGNDLSDVQSDTQFNEEMPEEKIEYTAYQVSDMMDDLAANPLKATDKYDNQYVEVTGRLSVIDSSGKYILIVPSNDEWAVRGVQCFLKNDEQKATVMDFEIGDTVTALGKITDVGEIIAYAMDVDEFK